MPAEGCKMGAALVITNTAPALSESPVCALLSPGEARPIASPTMNSVRSIYGLNGFSRMPPDQ